MFNNGRIYTQHNDDQQIRYHWRLQGRQVRGGIYVGRFSFDNFKCLARHSYNSMCDHLQKILQ